MEEPVAGRSDGTSVWVVQVSHGSLLHLPPLSLLPPSSFLRCDPALSGDCSGILSDPAWIDKEFQKAWLPYFSRSARGHASFSDFECEVEGWLPTLDEVDLHIFGDVLFDVVKKKSMTAGRVGWLVLEALPVSLYHDFAGILRLVKEEEHWPQGLQDAFVAMILEVDGVATPLGQRPLCVLLVVHWLWASV